jgi:hypothetical protein
MSGYKKITEIGPNEVLPIDNPITYCVGSKLDSMFAHGGHAETLGKNSKPCQAYMAQYCAKGWDKFCDIAAEDSQNHKPHYSLTSKYGLTSGENHIRATAAEKYLISMKNCSVKQEPFDPMVGTSPMVDYWVSSNCKAVETNNCSSQCTPSYAVDPTTIDDDIVMNKILEKPIIAVDIIKNIFFTMKRQGTVNSLRTTKLGNFFTTHDFFKKNGW